MIKKITISLASLMLFSILGFFIFSFAAKEDATSVTNQVVNASPPQFLPARPISDSLAYAFFENYHRSTTPDGSQGLLRNKGQAIVQFYADEASLIEPLKLKAQELGKEFIGISAIPAYDDKVNSHTLIWVAVIDADPGVGVTPELMLPKKGEQWQDYIYDFTAICPTDCPDKSDRLWHKDWNP